jgi:hypothetical protein
MPFRPPLLPADKPTSIKHGGRYKYIDFYIDLMNPCKSFDSSLGKHMCKAACLSGSMDSLNPHRWKASSSITMVVVFVGCLYCCESTRDVTSSLYVKIGT